ncbi:MAG: BatA domain-containing protein [Planctomycetota bacterium]
MPGLVNPGLLWLGISLVSVPVLIHLFFRHRHQRVRWAAMEFLLAALRKQKRRIRMENLLLLLVRCGLVLLLGLALARPRAHAGPLAPLVGGERGVVLVIDTSASMSARTERTSLHRAQEQAARLLQVLPASSRVTLVVTRDPEMGGAPRAAIERAAPEEVRRRLGMVRTTFGPNRLGEVFRFVRGKLEGMEGRRLVVFLTDLQRRDWRDDRGAVRPDVRRALRSLRRDDEEEPPTVVILDTGRSEMGNVVVSDFRRVEGREPIAGQALGLAARLVNYGERDVQGYLNLYRTRDEDGTEVKIAAQEVRLRRTVGAGSPAHADQSFYVLRPEDVEGPGRFRVAFERAAGGHDRLAADSRRHLALRVRPPIRIQPVRTVAGAVSVLQDVEVERSLDLLDPIEPGELGRLDLGATDLVVWADADVLALDPEAARNLDRFVRRGGGLLAYLGDRAEPVRTNALFFAERGEGLFPMRLSERPAVELSDEEAVELDLRAEIKHPLFMGMTADPRARVFFSDIPLRVTYYRPVEGYAEEDVVARWTSPDAAPAVLQHRVGRGNVAVVTTMPDERGKILNGTLIPALFFFDAAHYLVSEDDRRRNVGVGAPIRVTLPPGTRSVTVERPDPAGGALVEPIGDASKPFTFTDTAHPGFYRLILEPVAGAPAGPRRTHLAAVNVDPAEGDLRREPFETLQRSLPGVDLHLARDAASALPRHDLETRGELGRVLLAGVGGLLLVELMLAGLFGRRRRAAP